MTKTQLVFLSGLCRSEIEFLKQHWDCDWVQAILNGKAVQYRYTSLGGPSKYELWQDYRGGYLELSDNPTNLKIHKSYRNVEWRVKP